MVPASLFRSSLLLGSIASRVVPAVMALPASQPVPVHHLVSSGVAGLMGSVVNLLPVECTEGRRASAALFGRRPAHILSLVTLLFLAVLLFCAVTTMSSAGDGVGAVTALSLATTTFDGMSFFWAGLASVLRLKGGEDVPVKDDVTEVSNWRFRVFIGCMVLVAAVLMPFPGGLGLV